MPQIYTGVNGGTFNNLIPGPSAGEDVTDGSIEIVAQAAANQDKHLYDTKVAKAGDTMTGKLTVFAAGSSNQAGVDATGDGGGPGLYATGGDGDATGVIARGGKNNGNAVDAVADGLGTGVIATGGDAGGYGVYATGGANAGGTGGIGVFAAGGTGMTRGPGLVVGEGNAVFTGTSPAATANPGANNALSGANICKAWALIELTNAPAVTLLDGYNIASVTTGSTYVEVTFARAFASANYAPVIAPCDAGNEPIPRTDSRTTTTVRIHWLALSGGMPLNLTSLPAVTHVALQIFGRQ